MAGQLVTMNLQDSGDAWFHSGHRHPLHHPASRVVAANCPQQQAIQRAPSVSFAAGLNPQNNIKESMTMDSTPIDEVLSPEEMQGPPPQMMPTRCQRLRGRR